MTPRAILAGGVVILALAGAGGLYLRSIAASACDSEPAVREVTDTLRVQFHLDGVFINNIRTVAGGMFGDRHECSADVAAIRGNVNASDMAWREIRYRIDRGRNSDRPDVAVTLGGEVPLAEPARSVWARLLAYL